MEGKHRVLIASADIYDCLPQGQKKLLSIHYQNNIIMQIPSREIPSISSSSSSSSSSKHGSEENSGSSAGHDEGDRHSNDPTLNLIENIGSGQGECDSPGNMSLPVTVGGGGKTGASGAGGLLTLYSPGSSSAKRRKIDHTAGTSSGQKARKRTDLKDPPPGQPMCYECKKEFTSWKAVFGHLRSHPDRGYRGFLPPPVFESTQFLQMQEEEGAVGEEDAVMRSNGEEAAPRAREPWIDLNDEPTEETDECITGIDLNQPPATHEDTDEK